LPSHEVLSLIARIEGVPVDSILPNAPLARVVMPQDSNDWWSFIPALWLFSRLHGMDGFESESDRLKWWAARLPSLASEFEARAFGLATMRDLAPEDAAVQVCEGFSERTIAELKAFVDAAK
jgi:hypothetical protein